MARRRTTGTTKKKSTINKPVAAILTAVISVSIFLLLNPGGALDLVRGHQSLMGLWLSINLGAASIVFVLFRKTTDMRLAMGVVLVISSITGIVFIFQADALAWVEDMDWYIYWWMSLFLFMALLLSLFGKKRR